MVIKGFIKNMGGDTLLPVTRGELVKDQSGLCAFFSSKFLAEAPSSTSEGHPGLMTASEKALLSGIGTNDLKDLYARLQAIDDNLKVNDQNVPLSKNELNIVTSDSGITASLTEKDGNYKLELELDDVIADKELFNVTVPVMTNSDHSVVNKKYVDSLCNSATGALTFIGPVSEASELAKYMTENAVGSYFKATGTFRIEAGQDYQGNGFTTKVGDTLIIAKKSSAIYIVHIPSGNDDDTILYLGTTPLIGGHTLIASSPLSITKGSNTITFALPPASETTAGYLTPTDYKAFKTASQKDITYENFFEDGIKIGTLNTIPITIPKLQLTTDGSNVAIHYDGKKSDNKILVTGSGITVGANSGSLTLTPNINDSSKPQLDIDDNGKLYLNVWKSGSTDSNSLITLGAFASGVVNHVEFTQITDQTYMQLTDAEKKNLK